MVAKEVSVIENEMLEFKDSLAEWKGMPSLLHIDDSASIAGMFLSIYLSPPTDGLILGTKNADGMSVRL